jgi:ubiquinone/menaquinone biosynthesis C-methylase UbiE
MFKKFFQQVKFKAMARQLRKPGGMMGKKVGEMMNKANEFLYDFTLAQMKLADGEKVLEIGFGNGLFFDKLFSKANNLQLSGIDYSKLMVETAITNNKESIENGKLSLLNGSSDHLPYPDNSFDKIFCINVIYFWDNPQSHLKEITRVLKPGGRFYATIRTKESMNMMPFTKYGFTKYNEQEWSDLLPDSLQLLPVVTVDEPIVQFEGNPFQVQSLCLVAEKKQLTYN